MLELVQPYLPIAAIAGGMLLLLWSQRDRFVASAGTLRPTTKAEAGLSPHDLFERLYDLRSWCEAAGQAEAVKALDASVLPAIVRSGLASAPVVSEGGTKS